MKIAIIGRTEILYETAQLLNSNGHSIKLIITAKEAPEYKKTSKDFECLAKKLNAKFLYTSKINSDESIKFIRNCGSLDIGVSMNYPNIISNAVINLFPCGILNAHGGDLPRYRGNACQSWAIINGEDKIGLCIHKMAGDELDSGDIIEREYLNIEVNTKIGNVLNWMADRIPVMFLSALKKLEKDKNYILEKQSSNPLDILRCYPRIPEDGRIDWTKPNTEILRLINASNEPYSGAFCKFKKEKIVIWDAEIYDDKEIYCAVSGQIAKINDDGSVIVITGRGKLKINIIGYNGKKNPPNKIIKSLRCRLQ